MNHAAVCAAPGSALAAIFCAIFMIFASGCATDRITRTSDRRQVEFERMVQEIQDARLILIGETHNNKRDHRLQLQVIKALHAKGKRLAIGAEMFAAADQGDLAQWNEGRMDALRFRWLYEDSWSEPWPLYRDIFLYARDSKIPVIGLNFSRQLMRKVSTQGTASLSEKESALIPPAIYCEFDKPYTSFLRTIYQLHPGGLVSFEQFCAAQTLWNKGMARHLAGYLKQHPEQTVVALVGTFHAVKQAIPAEIPDLKWRVLVPELPGKLPVGVMDADFYYSH